MLTIESVEVHLDSLHKGQNELREDVRELRADNKSLRDKVDTLDKKIDAVDKSLSDTDLFRQFRQGDVSMERWDRVATTGDRLRQALSFLYY